MDPLFEFYNEIRNCQNCSLSQSRTHVVFGEGPSTAEIMFVGEAPGQNEDEQNRPFIGAAGKILSEQLNRIGLKREEVFIANVVKCRPPENRNPLKDEIASCLPYLWKQIEIIQPRVICSLGNFAGQALLERRIAITKVRGQYFQVRNFFVFPMLHPAAALHQGGMRRLIEEDFQNLKSFLAMDLNPGELPGPTGASVKSSR